MSPGERTAADAVGSGEYELIAADDDADGYLTIIVRHRATLALWATRIPPVGKKFLTRTPAWFSVAEAVRRLAEEGSR